MVFEILLSGLYLTSIIGMLLLTFILREKHPELSIFLIMISFFFMTAGFYTATEIANTIDGVPQSVLEIITNISFVVMIISIFVVIYFMLRFILTALKNMGGGK